LLDRARDRPDSLEPRQGDQPRRFRVHAGFREIDQRQVVLLGKCAGNPEGVSEAPVTERLGKGASQRSSANVLELLWRKETGLADQLGDQLASLADLRPGVLAVVFSCCD